MVEEEKKDLVEVIVDVINTAINKMPPAVKFTAARNLLKSVKDDVRNDCIAGQIKSPVDFAKSAGMAALTYAITDIALKHEKVRPIAEKTSKLFKGVNPKVLTFARDAFLDIGAGLASDLATGQIQQPVDIAKSVAASVMSTFLTDVVINKGVDIASGIKDKIEKKMKDNVEKDKPIAEDSNFIGFDIDRTSMFFKDEKTQAALKEGTRTAMKQDLERFGGNEKAAAAILAESGKSAANAQKEAKGWERKVPSRMPSLASIKESLAGVLTQGASQTQNMGLEKQMLPADAQ